MSQQKENCTSKKCGFVAENKTNPAKEDPIDIHSKDNISKYFAMDTQQLAQTKKRKFEELKSSSLQPPEIIAIDPEPVDTPIKRSKVTFNTPEDIEKTSLKLRRSTRKIKKPEIFTPNYDKRSLPSSTCDRRSNLKLRIKNVSPLSDPSKEKLHPFFSLVQEKIQKAKEEKNVAPKELLVAAGSSGTSNAGGSQISEFFLPPQKKKEVKVQKLRERFLQEIQKSREQTKIIAGDKPPNPFLLPNAAHYKTVRPQMPSSSMCSSHVKNISNIACVEFPLVDHITQLPSTSGTAAHSSRFAINLKHHHVVSEPLSETQKSENLKSLFDNAVTNILHSLCDTSPSENGNNRNNTSHNSGDSNNNNRYTFPEWTSVAIEQLVDCFPVQHLLRHLHQLQSSIISLYQSKNKPQFAVTTAEENNNKEDKYSETSQDETLYSEDITQHSDELSLTEESPLWDYSKLQQLFCGVMHKMSQYYSYFRNSSVMSTNQSSNAEKQLSCAQATKKIASTVETPENLLWTDLYAPTTVKECCSNSKVVNLLFIWLRRWKQRKKNEQRKSIKSTANDENEDVPLCNALLLKGPHGISKTAAVYACAHQLGYKVIEVNASSRRSGKQILQLFAEATQSHQMRTFNDISTHTDVEMPSNENQKGSTQSKLSFNSTTTKTNDSSTNERTSEISLILFEEIDVIFEDEDRGFFSALAELMQTTKRPIILTCNKLPRVLADGIAAGKYAGMLQLEFSRLPPVQLITTLSLYCLFQGIPFFDLADMKSLYRLVQFTECDLRKTLLNIQFWLEENSSQQLLKFAAALQRALDYFNQSSANYTPADVLQFFQNNLLSNEMYNVTRDRIKKNLLESFLGFSKIVAQCPSHCLWHILAKTTTFSLSKATTIFDALYGNHQNEIRKPNTTVQVSSPFNETNDKNATTDNKLDECNVTREDIDVVAEHSDELNLDLVHLNYLSFFTPPCLPHQQDLFIVHQKKETRCDSSIQKPPLPPTTTTSKEIPCTEREVNNSRLDISEFSAIASIKKVGQRVFDYVAAVSYDLSAQDYLHTLHPQVEHNWPTEFLPNAVHRRICSQISFLSLHNTLTLVKKMNLPSLFKVQHDYNTVTVEEYFKNLLDIEISNGNLSRTIESNRTQITRIVSPLIPLIARTAGDAIAVDYVSFFQRMCVLEEERRQNSTRRRYSTRFRSISATDAALLRDFAQYQSE
jgi:DNA polymerase III delta prime subunit